MFRAAIFFQRLISASTLVTVLGGLLLTACTGPVRKGERFAEEHRFEREIVVGATFRHVIFRNAVVSGDELHVYLDGDGSPYAGETVVRADPTPRKPLMLHLMALDTSPSLYVGRPCYWGLANDSKCGPTYWTFGRFNKEVVDSVSAVIRKALARRPTQRWSLYAHSGGATIALLVARQNGTPERIVTIGGNLDPDTWAIQHGYTPLFASENPAVDTTALGIPMTHYVGAADANTPPSFVRAASHQVGGEVVVVQTFSHTCCWEKVWPTILAADPHSRAPVLSP
jgi:hypothetical protein